MGCEIERKFLVADDSWRGSADSGARFIQGYLSRGPRCTVRVRISEDREAWVTLKGRPTGISRPEFEYPVPVEDAIELLEMCGPERVEKTRFRVPFGDHTWEVDVFSGANEGLVLAEVELEDESDEPEMPPWIGAEVSDDPRFSNSSLAVSPLPGFRD
jgi:adenylate cyclase